MTRIQSILTILFVVLALFWGHHSSMPPNSPDEVSEISTFSTNKALEHVSMLAARPHAVGFPAHQSVREYIVAELEALGLEVQLQQGLTAGDWNNLSEAINVMARIPGSKDGKALVLMSHYDSNPHSSYGASDAGSGVATILEGVRAYLATDPKPLNDIIILFTDAEELGLNGADLFVKEHPWAKETGLVLNFEARGSGGPSYMLLETNYGNSRLISEFIKAQPDYPVGNSLAYSIYKMLPNDTDLTVFREEGDIEGFNFAFIDDHYDYHTALDTPSRLDRSSLAHQGSYLMPLLLHFSNADLDLKSEEDMVYFNMPVFGLLSYPYSWIWPMWILGLLFFIALMAEGLRKKSLRPKQLLYGFFPMLLVMSICGFIGFYGFDFLLWIYPQYSEILQGFTYNGHYYIYAFIFLVIAVNFRLYSRYKDLSRAELTAGPLLLWLIICGLLAWALPGASYFILPVFAMLGGWMVAINQKHPPLSVMLFLSLPALWILAPLTVMFPIGLGLKMLVSTTLLTTLIFLMMYPLLGGIRHKKGLSVLCILLSAAYFLAAHLKADFNTDRPQPVSLLYFQDEDHKTAAWTTYDRELTNWHSPYLKQQAAAVKPPDIAFSSKYGTRFSHTATTPYQGITPPEIEVLKDTVVGQYRNLSIRVQSVRPVNRLEVAYSGGDIIEASANGQPLSVPGRAGRLFTHYISNNRATTIELSFTSKESLDLIFFEASNDLIGHPELEVAPRQDWMIPKPFVLNDAVVIKKTLHFE